MDNTTQAFLQCLPSTEEQIIAIVRQIHTDDAEQIAENLQFLVDMLVEKAGVTNKEAS